MPNLKDHCDLKDRWCQTLRNYDVVEKTHLNAFNYIIKQYNKHSRFYHTTDHLRFLFSQFDIHTDDIKDKERIFFSIWYHDLIYNIWRKDNERASAKYAEKILKKLGLQEDNIAKIYNLIVATASHDDPGTDDDDRLFLDMDMAILGAEPVIYQQYVDSIRKEYAPIPKAMFNTGRKAFLTTTLEKAAVFLTPYYREKYDHQARENMQYELAKL